MRLGEGLADEEFLANHHSAAGAYDLEILYSARSATLERDEFEDSAYLESSLLLEQGRDLVLRESDCPAIEVIGLLVVVVQDEFQHFAVGGVAIWIFDRLQIVIVLILPTGVERLGDTATALRKTRVADVAFTVKQHLSPRLFNRLCHKWRDLTCDALITLAVIVGTDIIESVLVMIPPFHDNIRRRNIGKQLFIGLGIYIINNIMLWGLMLGVLNLPQHPLTRDDSMGLDELKVVGSLHLA